MRRHATSVTLAAFFVGAVGLSVAPIPSWLKPTDLFDAEDPWVAIRDAVFRQPESIRLPDQEVDQVQATGDPLLLDTPGDSEAPVPEVRASTVARPRPVWRMPARPQLDRYAPRLGLAAAPLERPCLDPACGARALDRFFARLEAVERAEEGAQARVVHFGDSLIASDKISDRVRRRLQERFGSAGRGFLMGKRFNQFQRGQRSGRGSRGWKLQVMTASKRSLPDRHFGFSGASFTAQKAGETLRFEPIGGSRFLEIYYLARPRGGRLQLLADGEPVGTLDTKASVVTGTAAAFALPPATTRLVLKSLDRGARVYGVALDAEGPGVIWTTLGLPGASSEVWLRPNKNEFVRLLARRAPHLAVVMLGGNDGLMLSKKRTTAERIERETLALIDRIREAIPGIDCLLVSPLEAVRAKTGGRLIPKPEVLVVIRVLRSVAEQKGCAFWDMYASMGGKGSLKRWVDARLMLGDLIHPRSRGSDLLGEMMAEAIMKSYDGRAAESLPPSSP